MSLSLGGKGQMGLHLEAPLYHPRLKDTQQGFNGSEITRLGASSI